ncbi:GIY-YIG nuclease family protein [Bacillus subtilis]|uniref:GIY-YIG nuclease family protein n=1 Tax=Bacillus subtilis TaxID=1423 RepID=UPI002EB41DB7|nr:GIY-YIG nuclease family protein [Bacillus subtilis]
MFTEKELNWIRSVVDSYVPAVSPSYYYRKNAEFNRNKDKRKSKEYLDKLRKKLPTYSPEEILKYGQKSIRDQLGIENFSGIYIIKNRTYDKYYVGQAVKVYNRAFKHFSNEGNEYIYKDFISGNKFTIDLIPLYSSSYSTLNELEDIAIRAYEAFPKGYNRVYGNIIDKPIYHNEDFEKIVNLIIERIKDKDTEEFLDLTNIKKRRRYINNLFKAQGLGWDSPLSIYLFDAIKEEHKKLRKMDMK